MSGRASDLRQEQIRRSVAGTRLFVPGPGVLHRMGVTFEVQVMYSYFSWRNLM